MLGLILIVIVSWQIYKAANETGRNGVLWGVGTFFGSFILQLVIGLGLGIAYGLGMEFWGWSEEGLTVFSWFISLFAMGVNVLFIWLIWRYLNRVPEVSTYQPPPPPPASFN